MSRKPYLTLGLALCLGFCRAHLVTAQSVAPPPANSVITGRLTIKGEPAPHIVVLLLNQEQFNNRPTVAQTTTDADGRYRLSDLAAGNYAVQPRAPAYIASGNNSFFGAQKSVKLEAGETVNDVDFTLVRGGVITGRVIDAEGKPLISEQIRLSPADENKYTGSLGALAFRFRTDDRGIYRLYGVPPGRYVVSAGSERQEFIMGVSGQLYRSQTFHPNAITRAEAKIIEVGEGSEITGTDIVLAAPQPTFQATGRVVDAITGEPVAGAVITYGRVDEGYFSGTGSDNRPTDAEGRFTLESLKSGEYGAFLYNYRIPDNNYSNVTRFTIKDGDANGLEIKAQRGSTLNGVITLEGADNPAVLARLRALSFSVYQPTEGNERLRPNFGRSFKIAPDGSFRVMGLQPGAVQVQVASSDNRHGFRLVRTEQNGVPVPHGGLIAKSGADVNDVRFVFEYSAGRLIGQFNYINGALAEGEGIAIDLQAEESNRGYWAANPDVRGHFVIDGLKAGSYRIRARSFNSSRGGRDLLDQKIFIDAAGDTKLTFTIDLSKPTENGGRP